MRRSAAGTVRATPSTSRGPSPTEISTSICRSGAWWFSAASETQFVPGAPGNSRVRPLQNWDVYADLRRQRDVRVPAPTRQSQPVLRTPAQERESWVWSLRRVRPTDAEPERRDQNVGRRSL